MADAAQAHGRRTELGPSWELGAGIDCSVDPTRFTKSLSASWELLVGSCIMLGYTESSLSLSSTIGRRESPLVALESGRLSLARSLAHRALSP